MGSPQCVNITFRMYPLYGIAVRRIQTRVLRNAERGNWHSVRVAEKSSPTPEKRDYRNLWTTVKLQAKNEEWHMVCANVFGVRWRQCLERMRTVRAPIPV